MEEENQSDYSKHFENMFRKADKNQDGLISYQELKLMEELAHILENKRKRTRLQYKNNNEDDDNVDIGCIFNIPDFISKINNNEPNTI